MGVLINQTDLKLLCYRKAISSKFFSIIYYSIDI